MKPFLFETTDMIDTNPKKYIGPPVDPKTGKFKCSKHGKEDTCFDDTEVHTKEIPDEKVFFKPKEEKSMKENDSLFNDEDFEILGEGTSALRSYLLKSLRGPAPFTKKTSERWDGAIQANRDMQADRDENKKKYETKRQNSITSKLPQKKKDVKESFKDFLEAGGYLPPPSKNPNPAKPPIRGKTAFEYEQVQKRRAAENAPTKKSPIDYMKIKKKDVKESFNDEDFEILEADHKQYPEGSPEKRKAQSKSLQKKIVHKYIKNGEHEAAKQEVKYASQHGRAGNRYYRIFGPGERSNGSVGSFAADHARTWAVSALNKSPNRPSKKGDIETLTRGAVKEAVEKHDARTISGPEAKRKAQLNAEYAKKRYDSKSKEPFSGRLPQKEKSVKEAFKHFLDKEKELSEVETPVPQEKKFDHNSAILKWELEAVGIRTKNAPIVENPTPKVDYDEVAKSIFEKHKAKEVPVTIPTKFQEAIEKREKGNATLTKAFYDEYK